MNSNNSNNNNNNNRPYLEELRELDPIKLRNIRDKALETRRAKNERLKNFKDLLKGELSMCVVLRDKNTGQVKKDHNGRPILITKKELLALSVVDKAIENGNVKDLREIGEIIGDIDKRQENSVNVIFENLRSELLGIEQEREQEVNEIDDNNQMEMDI